MTNSNSFEEAARCQLADLQGREASPRRSNSFDKAAKESLDYLQGREKSPKRNGKKKILSPYEKLQKESLKAIEHFGENGPWLASEVLRISKIANEGDCQIREELNGKLHKFPAVELQMVCDMFYSNSDVRQAMEHSMEIAPGELRLLSTEQIHVLANSKACDISNLLKECRHWLSGLSSPNIRETWLTGLSVLYTGLEKVKQLNEQLNKLK
jgi:hypothetical protein